MKIAILGTGVMGSAMAEGLLKAGQSVVVYNRTASKTEYLASIGAQVAKSAAEAISQSEAVIFVLLDAQCVKQLLQQRDVQAVISGKRVLNATTTNLMEIREIQEIAKSQGFMLSECTIMAGAEQLKTRTCEFLLACDATSNEFWLNVLKNLGQNIHQLGEVGKATMAESPMIYGTMFLSAAAAYSVAVGIKLGVPHEIIKQQLLMFGPSMEPMINAMLERNYDSPMATTESFIGACSTGVSTAKQLNLPTNILTEILNLFEQTKKDGYGKKDGTSIMETLMKHSEQSK